MWFEAAFDANRECGWVSFTDLPFISQPQVRSDLSFGSSCRFHPTPLDVPVGWRSKMQNQNVGSQEKDSELTLRT